VVVDHANHPWVFWQSQANGRFRIQGRMYNGTWQPIFNLDTLGWDGPPKATVDGNGNIWVLWSGWQTGANHICYACRADSTWQPAQALTSGPANDFLPSVTTDPSGTVWACWQTGQSGAWAIHTSHYDGGWTQPDLVTDSTSDNYDPSIGADTSGNIWVAWASDRRGYWNIYAAQLPAQPSAVAGVDPRVCPPQFAVAPNPFARAVSFSGPERFSVEVFSISGRKLAHIEAQSAVRSSQFTVRWVPSKLPYGIYLARLASPGRQSVVKLLYTK
jgi:hypothetical protein